MNKRSPSAFAGARPLNAPHPLDVLANRHGEPVALRKVGWPRHRRVVLDVPLGLQLPETLTLGVVKGWGY